MEHVMKIQRPTRGHEEVTWDPADQASVAHAQQKFDLAVKDRLRPSKIERDPKTGQAKPGELITTFDPNLGEIAFVAALAGG